MKHFISEWAQKNEARNPQHIKEIIDEILQRNLLFKDVYPNTDLGIDLKFYTRKPGRLDLGLVLPGTIVRDGECHYTFVENAFEKNTAEPTQRNIPFFPGKHLNCTVRPSDLHVRLNFKELHFNPNFNIDAYAIELMMEVRKMLLEAKSLIEETKVM